MRNLDLHGKNDSGAYHKKGGFTHTNSFVDDS